jgi:hypothetical protein
MDSTARSADDHWHHCVATVAQKKAEERGFMFGFQREDWLCAEAEVLAQMYGLDGSSA